MKPLLEVVIPTYNRKQKLKNLVDSLLPYLNSAFSLLIIDNASTDDTEMYCQTLLHSNVRVIRNISNIGGVPNMLRCIEFAQGEFCWLLGDDDLINVESLGYLIKRLKTVQTDIIHLPSSKKALSEITDNCQLVFNNERDFLKNFYSLCEFQVMANNIYRVQVAQKYLCQAYRFCHLQHGYTVISYYLMIQDRGLEVLKIDMFQEESCIQEKRWTQIPAFIDAMETTFLLMQNKKMCMKREFHERYLLLLRLTIYGFLGKLNIGLDKDNMFRLFRLLFWPAKLFPLTIICCLYLVKISGFRFLFSFYIYIICLIRLKTYKSNEILSKLNIEKKPNQNIIYLFYKLLECKNTKDIFRN